MESPLQLKIVELALSKLSGNGHDSIGAIISDLLISDIPLSKAIELSHPGSLALLDFVWMRSLRDMEHSRWTVAKLLQSEKDYYKWEFSLALVRAIRRADLKMVQRILTHFSNCLEKEVVEEAAKGGHLWVLQLLETDNSHDGIEWGTTCMNNAAKSGHWDLVHWLHQRIGTPIYEPRFHGKIADYAFYQCNVEKLKWVIANGFELSNYLCVDKCDFSKREKCWEVVRYVLSEGHSKAAILVNRAAVEAVETSSLPYG
ncbi:hypothetical protein PHMEG_00014780 [Phytophthora megakarya]|uniref:Ankyrin repeat-containing domain n=1 Tax=Phytophthora megakarya TaxID=4795 RepID=A0A225W4J0_9STRA|nr:hypothetical protein PHMEG_00014780 [Phytophthora megakarya]